MLQATGSREAARELRALFQRAPTLGGECYSVSSAPADPPRSGFNGHPPLGVNATFALGAVAAALGYVGFNGHPPLGVNATTNGCGAYPCKHVLVAFQRAPTLGGECYALELASPVALHYADSFNGHPPLGVNATV